jgi:hypothetical protein
MIGVTKTNTPAAGKTFVRAIGEIGRGPWTDDPTQLIAALQFVNRIEIGLEAHLPERPGNIVVPNKLLNKLPHIQHPNL